MERTESLVVQVAPDYENNKIKEMQRFGWNLQNRQEIHEKGDAFGRPSFLDSSEYLIKTKVSHYVKLHFSRNLSLPNIDKIREFENEYFRVPFPVFPRLAPPGGIAGIILLFFWYPLWPLYYFFIYQKKMAADRTQLAETLERQQDILKKITNLLHQ